MEGIGISREVLKKLPEIKWGTEFIEYLFKGFKLRKDEWVYVRLKRIEPYCIYDHTCKIALKEEYQIEAFTERMDELIEFLRKKGLIIVPINETTASAFVILMKKGKIWEYVFYLYKTRPPFFVDDV